MRLSFFVLPSTLVGAALAAAFAVFLVAGSPEPSRLTELTLPAAAVTPAQAPAGTARNRGAQSPPASVATTLASAVPAPMISGTIPADGGTALVVTGEELSAQQILLALRDRGCHARSVWAADGGDLVGYIPLAPQTVSAAFPTLIAGGTALLAVCE